MIFSPKRNDQRAGKNIRKSYLLNDHTENSAIRKVNEIVMVILDDSQIVESPHFFCFTK